MVSVILGSSYHTDVLYVQVYSSIFVISLISDQLFDVIKTGFNAMIDSGVLLAIESAGFVGGNSKGISNAGHHCAGSVSK